MKETYINVNELKELLDLTKGNVAGKVDYEVVLDKAEEITGEIGDWLCLAQVLYFLVKRNEDVTLNKAIAVLQEFNFVITDEGEQNGN